MVVMESIMDIASMTKEEIAEDSDALILCLRCLNLLEFINANTFKEKDNIVAKYLVKLKKADSEDGYEEEFELFKAIIEQHITNSLVLLVELNLVTLYEGYWNLTTIGLDFYKEKAELLYNKPH